MDYYKNTLKNGDLTLNIQGSNRRINPREGQLERALTAIEPIQAACQSAGNNALKTIAEQLNPCTLIRDRIANEVQEEPPVALAKGGVMALGVILN